MVTVREVEVVRQVSLLGMTILVREAEEGGYWGEVYELPGCVSQGETLDELRRNIWEAIEAVCHIPKPGTQIRPSFDRLRRGRPPAAPHER